MTSSSNNSQKTNEWMDLQRQCMQTWIDAQRAFLEQSKDTNLDDGKKKVEDFFKDWQRNVFFNSPSSMNMGMGGNTFGADMFRHQFTDSGRGFLDMMNRMNGSGDTRRPEQVAMEWAERMRRILVDILDGKKDPMTAFDPLDFFASLPGLGSDREKQDEMNLLYKKWASFQKASFAYYQGMAKIGLDATQAFFDYIINTPEGEKPLETSREILNKWVEISEGTYRKYAHSENYMKLYGDTINALSEFQAQLNKVLDGILEKFNLPTRKEIDSLHKYVHDVKVENHKLRAEIKEIKAAINLNKKTSAGTTKAAAVATSKVVEQKSTKSSASKGKGKK